MMVLAVVMAVATAAALGVVCGVAASYGLAFKKATGQDDKLKPIADFAIINHLKPETKELICNCSYNNSQWWRYNHSIRHAFGTKKRKIIIGSRRRF